MPRLKKKTAQLPPPADRQVKTRASEGVVIRSDVAGAGAGERPSPVSRLRSGGNYNYWANPLSPALSWRTSRCHPPPRPSLQLTSSDPSKRAYRRKNKRGRWGRPNDVCDERVMTSVVLLVPRLPHACSTAAARVCACWGRLATTTRGCVPSLRMSRTPPLVHQSRTPAVNATERVCVRCRQRV